ncbi:hypothetical protein B7463_g638, partial [Scytalidium lignicola]
MPAPPQKSAIDRAAELLQQNGYRFILKTGGVTYSATLQHKDNLKQNQAAATPASAEPTKTESPATH